ncbi:MAG TPA: tetratricopeptide repeat protein [Spirochaetota bacterium]|nr:tetratricopeptide repeat protein [Spirochaetota bacterium]
MKWKKNSGQSPDGTPDYDEAVRKNRIRDITGEEKESRPRSGKKTIIILASIAALSLIAIAVLVFFIYKKPGSFLATTGEKQVEAPFEEKARTYAPESENLHIKRGMESYAKGYLNDAVAEFNEVLESDSTDKDKAIALTYLGMISDDRGKYRDAIEFYNRALTYDSENPEIYKNLALAYRHNKEYDQAIESAKKSISLRGNDVNTRLLLGNIYFEMNRYEDAINQYRRALDIEPDNPSVLYNLGAALMKQGDELSALEYFKKAGASDRIGEIAYKAYSRLGVVYTERRVWDLAEKYLKLAVSLRPHDPVGHYNLGIAYLRQNRNDEALKEFVQSEDLTRDDQVMLESLGEAFLSMKEYDHSLTAYNKILETSKRNVRILSRIGEIYYEKGELDLALEAYRKITMVEPATENARVAYINMGNIFDDTQQYDAAIEAYQKALSISDRDDGAYYNLGIAYKHADKPDLAIDSWRRAAELNDNSPKAPMALADYYYEKKLYDLAEKEYQRILQKWPAIQEAHFKMATIYYKRDELEFALKAYARVIEINDKNDLARKALINSAVIVSKRATDEEGINKARDMITKALLIKPGDAETLFSLGIIYFKQEMYDRAIETFYQALKGSREPSLVAEAYNNIGKSYYQKKMYKKALQAFTRGIEEDPSNEEIRLNRKTASQAYEEELANE